MLPGLTPDFTMPNQERRGDIMRTGSWT